MFTPHQSLHQFSPQRRQVLGANKRLSPKKAHLGNEEAFSVGPSKLFSDLKQTSSAKKASTSASVFGKSRAFGEKTNLSPQRDENAPRNAGDVPIKPRQGSAAPGSPKLKQKQRQLVSPSKVQSNSDAIFLASSSPSKRKKAARNEASSSDGSPVKATSAQLTPKAQRLQEFVTPAANVGHAGAMRQRLGEMMDAMREADASIQEGDTSVASLPTEEELYPEIEYMPQHVEVPYERPAELAGVPSGAEMGELMASIPLMGFYKATRPASIELQRQESLADVPNRIDMEPLNDPLPASLSDDADRDEPWPDVEVVETIVKTMPTARVATAPHRSAVRTVTSGSLHRTGLPSTSASSIRTSSVRPKQSAQNSTSKPASAPARGMLRSSGAPLRAPPPVARPAPASAAFAKPTTSSKTPFSGASTASRKPKALAEKNSNATVIRRKVTNPELLDFDNDVLAKAAQAKLQEAEQGFEGFVL